MFQASGNKKTKRFLSLLNTYFGIVQATHRVPTTRPTGAGRPHRGVHGARGDRGDRDGPRLCSTKSQRPCQGVKTKPRAARERGWIED